MVDYVNVICMKWGTKFSVEYVNILASMVKRHLTLPHRFICFTDQPAGLHSSIEHFPLPSISVPLKYDISPWRKLSMFSPSLGDLKGRALFLDLDVAIVDSIDCFFTYSDRFTIIENWTQKGQSIGNSSVYCFTIGAHAEIFEYYQAHTDEVLTTYDNEQIYLSRKIGNIGFWPESWCCSFKRHCIPSGLRRYWQSPILPSQTKIVVFHGLPTPPQAIHGGFHGNSFRKYTRPALWVADHWCIRE